MMTLEGKLREKNNMEDKNYIHLPQAFTKKNICDVVAGLKQAGYKIFDYYIDGKNHIHIARKNEKEIYFTNQQAVCTVCDYGNIYSSVFPLSIEGNHVEGIVPEVTWLKI